MTSKWQRGPTVAPKGMVFMCSNVWYVFHKLHKLHFLAQHCHAQSLAATNRETEQLNWLTVDSFFMSCSISWMASLIDNLYLLDLIVLVINWHVCELRGTIRGDPQETLCRVRSPILFVRLFSDVNTLPHWGQEVRLSHGSHLRKEQQCGRHAKLSRHRYMCAKSARAWARELVEALGTSVANNSLLCWMVFPPRRPFSIRRRYHFSRCAESYTLQWQWFDLTTLIRISKQKSSAESVKHETHV